MALKLVVFDMDGTLLRPKSSWQLLHDHFGTDNREMLARYLRHEVSDTEFVARDLELWAAANAAGGHSSFRGWPPHVPRAASTSGRGPG